MMRNVVFEPDRRGINEAGLKHAVRSFFKHVTDGVSVNALTPSSTVINPFDDEGYSTLGFHDPSNIYRVFFDFDERCFGFIEELSPMCMGAHPYGRLLGDKPHVAH
jgi:hypothetical protein